jgi:hypothetical protein
MADAAPEKRRASKNADSGGFSTLSNLALPNSVVQVVAQKVASSRPSVNAKTFDIWFLNCENENTAALQAEGPPVRRAPFDFYLALSTFFRMRRERSGARVGMKGLFWMRVLAVRGGLMLSESHLDRTLCRAATMRAQLT